MFVTLKKADVLQSIGFAETAATEEYARIVTGIGDTLKAVLEAGETAPVEVQEEFSRALKTARDHVEKIKTLKRMAEFSIADDVVLDANSFALLEPNLPAR